MKALVLAGGKGTRLRPITYAMAKQLVPVANKAVVEYGIEALVEAGITDIGIVVIEAGGPIEAALGDGSRFGARFAYIVQPEPLGLAHAVATAQPFLGDEDFAMYLGDNLIKSPLGGLVREFEASGAAATVLLTPVPDPERFGVAEMDGERVVRLEEKPAVPRSNLALVGVYLFDRRIHDVIARLRPSPRGEYEITEAIQGLIDGGEPVRSHIVAGYWKDTGTVEAMLDANRLVLEDIAPSFGDFGETVRIEGRVVVGEGATLVDCVVRGPAIIGPGCRLERCYVGPFTAVDAGARLAGVEIEDSIVLADAVMEDLPARVSGSLIGRGARVRGRAVRPVALRLVLGDASEVDLP